MASIVLSGNGSGSATWDLTWTNTTGENVRVVINYMDKSQFNSQIRLSWGSVEVRTTRLKAIGRNLAFAYSDVFLDETTSQTAVSISSQANNASGDLDRSSYSDSLPTELMLAPGQQFRARCGAYNIVIIPENG